MNASPITKIISWLEFLGKILHLVDCATVCGKSEVMLTMLSHSSPKGTSINDVGNFSGFLTPPSPWRQFLSTIRWQFWPIFDPSPLQIADLVYGRPLKIENFYLKSRFSKSSRTAQYRAIFSIYAWYSLTKGPQFYISELKCTNVSQWSTKKMYLTWQFVSTMMGKS